MQPKPIRDRSRFVESEFFNKKYTEIINIGKLIVIDKIRANLFFIFLNLRKKNVDISARTPPTVKHSFAS